MGFRDMRPIKQVARKRDFVSANFNREPTEKSGGPRRNEASEILLVPDFNPAKTDRRTDSTGSHALFLIPATP